MASLAQQPAGGAQESKKKGKPKATKLNIEEFVGTNNFKMVDSSWADIMEDEDVIVPPVSLPSAPKSMLGPEVDFALIPNTGPFKLQITNLQYEVTELQLSDLFKHLSVSQLRLNTENGRATGTASIELGSKQDLIDALELNNKQLNGRSLRIFLPNQDRYGDRDGRRGGGMRGGSYIDNTPSNWRSARSSTDAIYAPKSSSSFGEKVFPPPTVGFERRDRGDFGRRDGGGGGRFGGGDDFSRPPRNDFGGYGGGRRGDDFGGERRHDDFGRRDGGRDRRDRYGDDGGRGNHWGRGGGDREGGEGGEGGNWRRDGPRGDMPPPSSDRDFGRRDNRGFGGGRDRDEGAPPSRDSHGGGRDRRDDGGYERRERDFDRPRGPPSSHGGDDQYDAPRRSGGGDDYDQPRSFAPPPRDRTYSGRSDRSDERSHDGSAPHTKPAQQEERRPELRAERLKNLLGGEEEENKPASYSSIFGSAKPVDTLKREMEIEKRIADERAAKAEADAAAKAAAAAAAAEHPEADVEGGDPANPTSPVPEGGAPGEHRGPRGPRGDGRRMRENGDPNRRRDGERGERRFDGGDRNGGGFGGERRGDRRDGGRMGGGEGRMGRRDGADRRDGGRTFRDGERRDFGSRGFRDDGPRDGGAPRFQNDRTFYRQAGGPQRQEYGDQFGQDRPRYNSEGDEEKDKNYVTPNRYQLIGNNDNEE